MLVTVCAMVRNGLKNFLTREWKITQRERESESESESEREREREREREGEERRGEERREEREEKRYIYIHRGKKFGGDIQSLDLMATTEIHLTSIDLSLVIFNSYCRDL